MHIFALLLATQCAPLDNYVDSLLPDPVYVAVQTGAAGALGGTAAILVVFAVMYPLVAEGVIDVGNPLPYILGGGIVGVSLGAGIGAAVATNTRGGAPALVGLVALVLAAATGGATAITYAVPGLDSSLPTIVFFSGAAVTAIAAGAAQALTDE